MPQKLTDTPLGSTAAKEAPKPPGSASRPATATVADTPASQVLYGYPSALEVLVAVVFFAVAVALLFGGHVANGGLYTDDWPIAAIQAQDGTSGLIRDLFLGDHARPVTAVYLGIAQGLTGTDGGAHAAIGLGLHVLKCGALYWLLRRLAMTWWQAGAVGALDLLFPFADSVWLWFAVTQSNLAIAMILLGFVAALGGLEATGRRAVALHATAATLFALSMLTYEVGAVIILLSVLLYLPRVPRPRALRLWAVDVSAVVVAAGVPRVPGLLPGTIPHETLPPAEQLDHARSMADQAASLLTSAAVPFGGPHRNVVLPVLLLIGAISVVAWRRSAPGSLRRADLRRWLTWALAGALVIAAAYIVFVPTSAVWYQPTATGSDNRLNAFPAIGYCLLLFSLAMLVGVTFDRWLPRMGLIAIAAFATTFLAVGYANRARDDVRLWDRAAALQRSELTRLGDAVGTPPQSSTIFAFGGSGRAAPGVWSFGVTWDLNGAVQLKWRDRTLRAFPIFAGTTIVCGSGSLYPDGFGNGNSAAQRTDYGQALFVDLRDGRRLLVRNGRECLRAREQFVPGPRAA